MAPSAPEPVVDPTIAPEDAMAVLGHLQTGLPNNNVLIDVPNGSHLSHLASPPWHHVPGVNNFRELIDYPLAADAPPTLSCATPRSFRQGIVYRSAEPSKITAEGVKKLRDELGIRKVFDLRSERELKKLEAVKMGKIEIEGVQREFVPVFGEEGYAPDILSQRYADYCSGDLSRAYRSILLSAGPAYTHILRHLLENPSSPILLHCTAGKDRTGVFCALLLLLAGVDNDTITLEYSLTTIGLDSIRETILGYLQVTKPNQHQGCHDEIGRTGAENMMSSKRECMKRTLELLEDEFGGVRGYLKSICGFNDDEIDRLRDNLVSGKEGVDTALIEKMLHLKH